MDGFQRVAQLVKAIPVHLAARKGKPKQYHWETAGKEILAVIHRANRARTLQPTQQEARRPGS